MAPRAPHGVTTLIDRAAGLGHGLLRLYVEDAHDAQPRQDDAGTVTLVADARLDNRAALGEALGLAPATLGDLPDSALILRAYQQWGDACTDHLLGDFAFAIWDAPQRRLLLARDHSGQRPIHYHLGADFLAFASDFHALWALPDVPRDLDDEMIGRRLVGASDPRPGKTPFRGIAGVPGGHRLHVAADGSHRLDRYWTPAPDPAHLGRDEAYYVAAYRRVLGEAVACRVRRLIDPPGMLLSGGYDSAAVAGLAGKPLAERGHQLIAASSVMPEDYRGTIRHAGRWVDACARVMPWLKIVRVTREGLDPLADLPAQLERGLASSYAFVHDALGKALAEGGARLVMDGHGGDYTLNPRGQAAMARLFKQGRLRGYVHELRAHRRMTGASWFTAIFRDTLAYAAPWVLRTTWRRRLGKVPPWGMRPVQPDYAARLFAEGTADPTKLRGAASDQTKLATCLAQVIERQVANGSYDATFARHGLVLSRPFHDKRVMELALAIPEDLYLKNGRSRYLACRALADLYPPEYQTRNRKNDDEIPDFQRIISSIKPQLLADIDRLEQREQLKAMIDFAKVRALLDVRGPDDHNSGWEQETQLAMEGYMAARLIDAFRRRND